MSTYLTLTSFKGFIGQSASVTTWDTYQQMVLDGVEQTISTFLGYDPAYASATEYYSGNGTFTIVLDRRPVLDASAITAVYQASAGYWGQGSGDAFPSTSLLTKGVDYAVRVEGVSKSAILVNLTTPWPWQFERLPTRLGYNQGPMPGCIKVTYIAGWTLGYPMDVLSTAYMEAAARWSMRLNGMGALMNESMDGYSIGLSQIQQKDTKGSSTPFVSPLMVDVLRPYKLKSFSRI